MKLSQIDRRIIYLLVALALLVPLLKRWSVTPARLPAAEKLYTLIESLPSDSGKVALVAFDYGPNLIAENGSQARVIVEHLMRRRIPVLLLSLYSQAEPFLTSVPEQVAADLMREFPEEQWVYGKDWVNLGYRVGGFQAVQSFAKSENLVETLKKDALGNVLAELPAMRTVRTLKDIQIVAEVTGLVGMLDIYLQFLQRADYRPPIVHGCTSITIPDAYIFLDSGQLRGLLEGIAGAAWYSELLRKAHPVRAKDDAQILNTGLGVAHLVIIALIIIGNVALFFEHRQKKGAHG